MKERKKVALLHKEWCETSGRMIEGAFNVAGIRQRVEFRDFPLVRGGADLVFAEQWKPDGVLMTIDPGDPRVESIQKLDVPVVKLHPEWREDPFPTVSSDIHSECLKVLQHFQKLSFHHFLFVGTEGSEASRRTGRVLRWMARNMRMLTYNEIGIPLGKSGAALGLASMDENSLLLRALQKAPKPCGVYVACEATAVSLCNICRELGMSVPGDVAILAGSDTRSTQFCDPALSALVQDNQEIGRRGMVMLESLMAGEQLQKRVERVPVLGLHARASTLGSDPVDHSIERIRRIIQERACDGVTVENLISNVDISRPTLEKRYRELTGISPAQEIRRLRAERARELLIKTDLSVAQVARRVGFDDPRPFMVFFKREFGCTPGSYRHEHAG